MEEQKVTVSRRGAERLAAGHLWIYRADVERAPAAAAGDVVAVVDGRGRFLAKAFWSSRSKIALRIVTRDEVPVDEAFFADRIAAGGGPAPPRVRRRALRPDRPRRGGSPARAGGRPVRRRRRAADARPRDRPAEAPPRRARRGGARRAHHRRAERRPRPRARGARAGEGRRARGRAGPGRLPRGRGPDDHRPPRRAEDGRVPRPAREPPARRRVRTRSLPRLLQLRRRLRAAARRARRAGHRGRDAARRGGAPAGERRR